MKMKDFGFRRGVNLGGWFSQCDYSRERLDHFITEKDLDVIAGWGLDHVRVPVDYNILESEDGQFSTEGFERIRKVTEQCRARGLRVVLDLHKTAGFSFDKDEQEEGFFIPSNNICKPPVKNSFLLSSFILLKLFSSSSC